MAAVEGRYDVVVVGGGPGGATASAFLARAGLRVACLERERFPRFHIGESLLPASVPLFDRLGVRSRLEGAGFLRKHGAAFFDEAGSREVFFHFRPGRTWADHAYNVPRADFDRLLLEHAVKEGAAVFEGAEVREVTIEPGGVRLGVRTDDGRSHTVEAGFLVDATGRDALLASKVGRREPMPTLGKAALYAHFGGAARWAGRREGYIRIYLFEHGWFWWIPFAGDLTSVGCVLHQRAMRARQLPLPDLFEAMVAECPGVAAGLVGATRTTEVMSAANFSYRTEPTTGERFLAIGDAAAFVDPIFSTGVYVAMQSAELAAAAIVDGFRRGAIPAARLARYRRVVAGGTGLLFRLIDRFYDPAFLDVFFLPSPPSVLKDAVTTVLVGGAFLRRPAWLRAGLGVVDLRTRYARHRRRRLGLPVESRFSW